jgi:ABC-type transport system involved in cytochrome bd biosynthesis fused ATPase/permease subunit
LIKNFNFEIFGNKKICVVGSQGSGKTSLLMAMSGELKVKLGEMIVNGSVCYINLRERVFFVGTLRENIILDDPYNVIRYKQVLQSVDLDPSLFPGGDMVEVLENGSNFTQIDR